MVHIGFACAPVAAGTTLRGVGTTWCRLLTLGEQGEIYRPRRLPRPRAATISIKIMLSLDDQSLARLIIGATAVPRRARGRWLRKLAREAQAQHRRRRLRTLGQIRPQARNDDGD